MSMHQITTLFFKELECGKNKNKHRTQIIYNCLKIKFIFKMMQKFIIVKGKKNEERNCPFGLTKSDSE